MTHPAKSKVRRVWRIRGYDSLDVIFEKIIPLGCLSEKQAIVLLQRLCSQHLDAEDVVSATLRRNCLGHLKIFEPRKDGPPNAKRFMISVGENPYYEASVWTKTELAERAARLGP